MGIKLGILLAAFAMVASGAQGSSAGGIETLHHGQATAQSDMTGKGAVLCSWSIYEAIRAAGEECFKGQAPELQAELDRSLANIDQFIIKNSSRPVTKADLEAREMAALKQLHAHGDICRGAAAQLYQAVRAGGATKLRASTADLLSIPREPVMNPCL